MRKSTQAKLSILCLLLITRTTFASDFQGLSGLQKSEQLRLNVGDLKGLGGARPGVIPKTFNPEGLNNLSPFKPKIPGSFGTPQAELTKGNVGQAKVSCIQEAVNGGVSIANVGASSAWEFAAKDLPKTPPAFLIKGNAFASLKLKTGSKTPKAFADKAMCGAESVRHSTCSKLLSKSLSEVPQAYYKSEVSENPSVWEEVAAFLGIGLKLDDSARPLDLKESLLKEAKEQGGEGLSSSGIKESIQSEDQLLLATSLLVARIDEALSRGDNETSDRAKALLKRINPSAEHAVNCVLSNVPRGGLNDNLDPSGRPVSGSMVGPLSGIDYGSQQALLTHGSSGAAITAISALVVAGMSVASFIKGWIDRNEDEKYKDAEKADRERVIASAELKEYMTCDLGAACAELYPEAAAAVAKAKETTGKKSEEQKGTEGPAKPMETPEGDMWAPSVKQDPVPGSGGKGGELLPPDWNMVNIEAIKGVKVGSEANSRVDQEAAQRFCAKIVRDYKMFATKKATSGGKPVETLPRPIAVGDEISSVGFSVAAFDQWDRDFWENQIEIYENDPANRDTENNCNTMNPVRPE